MSSTIIINLKTYQQGKEVIELVKKIEKVDRNIIIGVQAVDIFKVSSEIKNPVFAEHVDFGEIGRNTGYVLPQAVKENGAKGVFLNHSEHALNFDVIKKTVEQCKKLKLRTAIFAKDLKDAKKIKKLKPTYLIIEPPELVAGKISVSSARPGLIKKISKSLKYDFLVGAGIKTKEDIKTANKLGAKGIAVSSVITKANNPEKTLRELLGK